LISKEGANVNKSSQKTGGKGVCTSASNFSGYEAVINNERKKRGSTLDKPPSNELLNDSGTHSGNPPGTGTENNNTKKETRSSQEKSVSNNETSVYRPNQERQVITNLCKEKNFEMSQIEMPTYHLSIACIYRSPESQLQKVYEQSRNSYSNIIA
jgi:hypothetical protein